MPNSDSSNPSDLNQSGNQTNQNNNNNMSINDIPASNPSNNNTDTGATIGIRTLASGMQVSTKKLRSKLQLQAWEFVKAHTQVGFATPRRKVEYWNALPLEVRNAPRLIETAVLSTPYFDFTGRNNATLEQVKHRTQMLMLCKSLYLTDDYKHNVLSWISKHSNFLQHNFRYDFDGFVNLLRKQYWFEGGTKHEQAFKPELVALAIKSIQPNWEDVRNVCQWIERIKSVRRNRHANRTEAAARWAGDGSIRARLDAEINRILSVRPIHWAGSLTTYQQRIAHRIRPEGACLGIELEFVAERDSDILDWSENDFPKERFHSFKTDGSIQPIADDEATAYYQEYTCFINGNDPTDWSKVRATLKAITESGARVNSSCGNHVHIDMRHKSQASYYRVAGRLRSAINAWAHRLVPYKRAYNRYCGIQNDHQNNRYTAVNTACYNEHRTVEVRLGVATLNYEKLWYWSRFLQFIANSTSSIDTFDEFMSSDAPMDLKYYAITRITKFESTYARNNIAMLPNFEQYKDAMKALQNLPFEWNTTKCRDATEGY
jgi:hypothetical protein